MIAKLWTRRTAALVLAAATAGIVPAVGSLSSTVSAQEAGLGAGGEFFPITPARVINTRDGAPVPLDGSIEVPVTGVNGVPADGVLAVAVNITVINPAGRGYMSVSPSDYAPSPGTEPTTLVNFQAGDILPNFAIVGVGSEGRIRIDLVDELGTGGSANVTVDVFGFVATSDYASDGSSGPAASTGARIVPQDPNRVLDTRPGNPPSGDATDAPLGPGQWLEVPIRGLAGVPDDPSVTGVVFNAAASKPTTTTYLSVAPEPFTDANGDARTANANLTAGQIRSVHVMSPINENGSVYVFNRSGQTDVTLDVVGYVQTTDDDSLAGRIVPLEAPFRSFDTRTDEFGNQKLGFSSWEDWSFEAFAGSVTLDGEPVGAQSGLLGNLAAFNLEPNFAGESVQSFMTLNPTDGRDRATTEGHGQGSTPGNANLNIGLGEVVTNMSLLTYGDDGAGDTNMISAYNNDGSVHYTLDVYAVILAE